MKRVVINRAIELGRTLELKASLERLIDCEKREFELEVNRASDEEEKLIIKTLHRDSLRMYTQIMAKYDHKISYLESMLGFTDEVVYEEAEV